MRFLTYGTSSKKLAGIETFLFNMNEHMPEGITFDYIIENNCTIHQSTIESFGGRVLSVAYKKHIIRNILDWNKLLCREKTENDTAKLVYFNMFSLVWIVPILLCKIHGYKTIIHAHNNNLHDFGIVQRLLHNLNRFILQNFNIVRFANSNLSAKFFFGKRPAEIIYNAIDTKKFAFNTEIRNKIREKYQINEKNLYGFAGRLENSKNPLFLIDVFSKISKIDTNASFLVCGAGSLMDEMKKQAKANNIGVIFTGEVTNIQDYYQAMDIFILPSRSEGLGLVLIEAQASGLPCIASADVIPIEAKATDLLEFVPLEQGPDKWGEVCVEKIKNAQGNRSQFSLIIQDTNYEITKEAPRLAGLLDRCAND